MAAPSSYKRGIAAERWAALWLQLKGYRILERRWKSPAGEIDLIATRGGTLAFVEVKARPTRAEAMEAIRPAQQARLTRAAEVFLARHPKLATRTQRFDVLLIVPRRWPRHIADAWQA